MLPIKAVILNLLSLAAAYGIVVFIFQEGHGSSLWGISATQAIPAWIPLMSIHRCRRFPPPIAR